MRIHHEDNLPLLELRITVLHQLIWVAVSVLEHEAKRRLKSLELVVVFAWLS
jgi:hypothetical protein